MIGKQNPSANAEAFATSLKRETTLPPQSRSGTLRRFTAVPLPLRGGYFACCKPFPRSRAARALRVRLRANTTTRCPRSAQDDTKGVRKTALDKTFVYRYNSIGNVTQVKEYPYATGSLPAAVVETAYEYNGIHPDRLTSFGGTSISYNAMGCPTTVNGYNTAWAKGKLSALSKGTAAVGQHIYNYSYNAYGQRIGVRYTFWLSAPSSAIAMGTLMGYTKAFCYDQSGRLICERKIGNYYGEGTASEQTVFLYDETGIIGMMYTGTNGTTATYYFRRNLLGDVIGIYNTNGDKVGGYAYDAWGNCTITLNTNDIATKNPIRYRGYYYDQDTGLYYLNARYYSPTWRRFISPDDTSYLDPEIESGLNLYCYCNDDPVNYADPSGHSWETVFDIGFAIWSLVDFIKDPTWANAGWLALDALALVVPFLPAGSKVITRVDDIVDAVGFVNKYDEVIVLGQSMATRVTPYADEIGAAIYGGLTNYSELERASGTVLATIIGYTDNMAFIINKSLMGAKFIDYGFDATRSLKGLKGMKLFTEIASRITIYSEKFFAQLFRKKNVFRYFRNTIF